MDLTCGGQWWREMAMQALRRSATGTFEQVAAAVAEEYAARLAQAASMMAVTVPVGRRINRQSIFHLVFMTRSEYGLWVFADALARARQAWLRAVGDAVRDVSEPLLTAADYMTQQLDAEREQAVRIVVANLREIAARQVAFKLVEHPRAVFGEAYGAATEAVVSEAVARLASNGELVVYGKPKRFRDSYVGRPRT